MNDHHLQRRQILKFGGATLAMLPILLVARRADAAINKKMRDALNYQDTPEGGQKCANCATFTPGANATALGRCKNFPGDTEIAPQGYCMAWAKKA